MVRGQRSTVVTVVGDLDLTSAPALWARLVDEIAQGTTDIIVDMAEVTFVDCVGLSPLVGASIRLKHHGGLRVRRPAPRVALVLRLTGLECPLVEPSCERQRQRLTSETVSARRLSQRAAGWRGARTETLGGEHAEQAPVALQDVPRSTSRTRTAP